MPDPTDFARRYSGFFDAPALDFYTFTLTSDDGSLLYLDGVGTPLLDNTTPTCESPLHDD